MMQTSLRFIGDWSPWAGALLALALAALAWRLYRRETRSHKSWTSWFLPLLRSIVVALLVLMLTGPVLHHQRMLGRTGRILVAVDASQSMSVADGAMRPGRRLLAAASLGLVPPGVFKGEALAAGRGLLRAQVAAGEKDNKKAVAGVIRGVQQALDHLDEALKNEFRQDVLDPAFALERADAAVLPNNLAALSGKLEAWRARVRKLAEDEAEAAVRAGRPEAAEALRKFDAMTRWQRAEALLTRGPDPLLGELAREHNVDAVAFGAASLQPLWSGRAGTVNEDNPLSATLHVASASRATNLDLALQAALAKNDEANKAAAVPKPNEPAGAGREPLAVVLLTDGRHNFGPPPLGSAQKCAGQAIPVFTIGLGNDEPPRDLAVDRIEAPQWIYHKDHLKGQVILKDDMPVGKPFKLRITCGGKVLWEKETVTTGEHQHPVDFDFSAEEYLKEKLKDAKELTLRSTTLELRAEVAGLEKEDGERRNDALDFPVRATFHRNKLLILDGRPRWEFRYLRDLFERDAKWEVTTIVADPSAPDGGIRRGQSPGDFPASREALFDYELVFLGDFPAQYLKADELKWLREFVGERGGGLILIDGDRGSLRQYGPTPLGELVPVAWSGAAALPAPTALRLTEKGKLRLTRQGREIEALALAATSGESATIWDSLLPPHWLAPAKALPGAEVLLEALADAQQTFPALVARRYGQGKVLYSAFDETWRFRFRVADRHHTRYWSQVAGWMMAPAYAASDKLVSLDAGPLLYSVGRSVEIRSRVRDAQGRAVMNAKVTARLSVDGKDVASVPLAPDGESSEYRGQTDALPGGHYEVRLEVEGIPNDQLRARTDFYVQAPEAGELTELSCDEPLLKQLAADSRGEYFREENARDVTARLQPVLQPQVVESELVLWQSWWWFGLIATLLTLEWLIRKKVGLL